MNNVAALRDPGSWILLPGFGILLVKIEKGSGAHGNAILTRN